MSDNAADRWSELIHDFNQARVVRKVDNAIHQINHYPSGWPSLLILLTFIHWIVMYLVDSIIQPSNNRSQQFTMNFFYYT